MRTKIGAQTNAFANSAPLLGCCLMCVIATGCAFSRTETKVNFAPTVSRPLKPSPKAFLQVGEIKDSRPVKDEHVLMHKQNAYGTTTGAYVTKEPVAQIIRGGLVEALQRNGFSGSTTGNYELSGDLQEFEISTIAGMWKATVKPKLSMRFELVDKTSGRSVWHETYISRDTAETAWGTKELLADLFSKVTDELVRQLISDGNFRGFFE